MVGIFSLFIWPGWFFWLLLLEWILFLSFVHPRYSDFFSTLVEILCNQSEIINNLCAVWISAIWICFESHISWWFWKKCFVNSCPQSDQWCLNSLSLHDCTIVLFILQRESWSILEQLLKHFFTWRCQVSSFRQVNFFQKVKWASDQ